MYRHYIVLVSRLFSCMFDYLKAVINRVSTSRLTRAVSLPLFSSVPCLALWLLIAPIGKPDYSDDTVRDHTLTGPVLSEVRPLRLSYLPETKRSCRSELVGAFLPICRVQPRFDPM
jgi:hypothetical protein